MQEKVKKGVLLRNIAEKPIKWSKKAKRKKKQKKKNKEK